MCLQHADKKNTQHAVHRCTPEQSGQVRHSLDYLFSRGDVRSELESTSSADQQEIMTRGETAALIIQT